MRAGLMLALVHCVALAPGVCRADEEELWKQIDALEFAKVKCDEGLKPSYIGCEDESGLSIGPNYTESDSLHTSRKGLFTRDPADPSRRINHVIGYDKYRKPEYRGTMIDGTRVGTWIYFWEDGERRLQVNYPPQGPVTVIVWGRDGKAMSGDLLNRNCLEIATPTPGGCPWISQVKKGAIQNDEYEIRHVAISYPPGVQGAYGSRPVLIRGATLESIQERVVRVLENGGQAIAYRGRSERVLLVVTSPVIDESTSKASHYRVRVVGTPGCSGECQISTSILRMETKSKDGELDWQDAIAGDDAMTREIDKAISDYLDDIEMEPKPGSENPLRPRLPLRIFK